MDWIVDDDIDDGNPKNILENANKSLMSLKQEYYKHFSSLESGWSIKS